MYSAYYYLGWFAFFGASLLIVVTCYWILFTSRRRPGKKEAGLDEIDRLRQVNAAIYNKYLPQNSSQLINTYLCYDQFLQNTLRGEESALEPENIQIEEMHAKRPATKSRSHNGALPPTELTGYSPLRAGYDDAFRSADRAQMRTPYSDPTRTSDLDQLQKPDHNSKRTTEHKSSQTQDFNPTGTQNRTAGHEKSRMAGYEALKAAGSRIEKTLHHISSNGVQSQHPTLQKRHSLPNIERGYRVLQAAKSLFAADKPWSRQSSHRSKKRRKNRDRRRCQSDASENRRHKSSSHNHLELPNTADNPSRLSAESAQFPNLSRSHSHHNCTEDKHTVGSTIGSFLEVPDGRHRQRSSTQNSTSSQYSYTSLKTARQELEKQTKPPRSRREHMTLDLRPPRNDSSTAVKSTKPSRRAWDEVNRELPSGDYIVYHPPRSHNITQNGMC